MGVRYLNSFADGGPSGKLTSGAYSTGTSGARTVGGYYGFNNTTAKVKTFPSGVTEIFVGLGIYIATDVQIRLGSDAGATTHLTFRRNSGAKQYEVRRGAGTGGTLLATGASVVNDTSWHYVELRAIISDTVGVAQLRINGSVSNELDFSGDTRNAGTSALIDTVSIHPSNTLDRYADWRIHDTVADVIGAPVSWLGDTLVVPIVPDGAGHYTDGTGSDGDSVDNYALLDELPASTTDYVTLAVGQRATYAMSALPAGATTVHAVQAQILAAKSDAGTLAAKIAARSGGTDSDSAATALGTSYAALTRVLHDNPAGGLWTPSAVNALELGAVAE